MILASASPRRAELLRQVGLRFEVKPADIDETMLSTETPEQYVRRLSLEKASAIYAKMRSDNQSSESTEALGSLLVLGADTIVVHKDQVFGKPSDCSEFKDTMNLLSGNRHQVMSAISVVSAQNSDTVVSLTDVYFRDLAATEIDAYWQTGEPRDKAGGYAIQGLGASFVQRIEGSYSGVMGLPLFELSQMLKRFGVFVFGEE